MDLCSSLLASCLSSSLIKPPQLLTSSLITDSIVPNCSGRKRQSRHVLKASAGPFSYRKFIHFALDETKRRTLLIPSPLQEKYSSLTAMDGTTELKMLSFQAPKMRLLRSLSIENEAIKILDLAVFARPEFDAPIFCANFFTTATHEHHCAGPQPLARCLRYSELFPWGGKLTSESLKFFSPIVIWTKFPPSQDRYDCLYSAFKEYYQAWLELIAQAPEEIDPSYIKSKS
ncbi:hypothetical protein OIU78_018981 [Salix suchowensis]|nr:hypothetical protein OIU78_018981 [Salix suchowensis]